HRSRASSRGGARGGGAAPRRQRRRADRRIGAFVRGDAAGRRRDRSVGRRTRDGGGTVIGRGDNEVSAALLSGLEALDTARRDVSAGLVLDEVGRVTAVARGVATVSGLPGAVAGERVELGHGA